MRPAGGCSRASAAVATSIGTSLASRTPSTPSRFCALKLPIIGDANSALPQGVFTASAMPLPDILISLAAMSPAASP